MIANLSFLRKRADIDRREFRDHWISPHGALAAQLPKLQSYVQNHVIESELTGTVDAGFRIDGVPVLGFGSRADLTTAYQSPILAECNVDSEAFIGAVSRIVATPHKHEKTPAPADAGQPTTMLFVLVGDGGGDMAWLKATTELLLESDGVAECTGYDIVSQAAAPNSKIQDLGMAIAGVVEATFYNRKSAERVLTGFRALTPRVCRLTVYEVEPIRLA